MYCMTVFEIIGFQKCALVQVSPIAKLKMSLPNISLYDASNSRLINSHSMKLNIICHCSLTYVMNNSRNRFTYILWQMFFIL